MSFRRYGLLAIGVVVLGLMAWGVLPGSVVQAQTEPTATRTPYSFTPAPTSGVILTSTLPGVYPTVQGTLVCPSQSLVTPGAFMEPTYLAQCGSCFMVTATPNPVQKTVDALNQVVLDQASEMATAQACMAYQATNQPGAGTGTPECLGPTETTTPEPTVTTTPQGPHFYKVAVNRTSATLLHVYQVVAGGYDMHTELDTSSACGQDTLRAHLVASYLSVGQIKLDDYNWTISSSLGSNNRNLVYPDGANRVYTGSFVRHMCYAPNQGGLDSCNFAADYFVGEGSYVALNIFNDTTTVSLYSRYVWGGTFWMTEEYQVCYGSHDPGLSPSPTPTVTPISGDCSVPRYTDQKPAADIGGFTFTKSSCYGILPGIDQAVPWTTEHIKVPQTDLCVSWYTFPKIEIMGFVLPASVFAVLPLAFFVRRLFDL